MKADARPTPPLPSPPAAMLEQAWALQYVPPDERQNVDRDAAALLIDGLLVRVARSDRAVEVAIAETLAALAEGDRTLQLGYSGIGDYARERLGIAGRTAQSRVRLARALRERPLLRAAVRAGEVSMRRAEAVVPVARGDAEAAWVERARKTTVRELEKEVRSGQTPSADDDEPWDRILLTVEPQARAKLDEAMDVAGKLLGAASPKWQRLEAMCQEFLGAHPTDPGEEEEEKPDAVLHSPVSDWLEAAKEGLEWEYERWTFLEAVPPVPAPDAERIETCDDALALDRELRRLARMRAGWDELVGHLGMLVQNVGLWRDMGFATFGHYATERLGMSARAIEQRTALERRFCWLPGLREALREGRVSYEQARIIARRADETNVAAWIARAEGTTCIALQREAAAEEEAQMCARGVFELPVPRRVRILVDAAFRAARQTSRRWLTPSECLERVAEHFVETWNEAVKRRSTSSRKVQERDRGFCTVPGCSRPSVHAHHLAYLSRGGSDDLANQTGLCAPHHLHGVHRGFIRVTGTAPDALRWELLVPPAALGAVDEDEPLD